MKPTLITQDLLKSWPLPLPDAAGNKEDRGRVLVIAGSREMPGAAVLAGTAVLRAGAGRIRMALGESIASAVGISVPESRVFGMAETPAGGIVASCADRMCELARSSRTVLLGPGMIDESDLAAIVRTMAATVELPLVLDAAGMSVLSEDATILHRIAGRAIVTPHAGEMAHMLGWVKDAVTRDCAAAATHAAEQLRAVVVLKGRETFVTSPDGDVFVNRAGNVGLATAGSGDVLAGVIAGLSARGSNPMQAAAWGVYLHAAAGDRLASRVGSIGFLARELLSEIPEVMAALSE